MASWKFALVATLMVLAQAEEPRRDPQCFTGKLDLVLVVDVSGSSESRFGANRDAAWELSKSLPINAEKVLIAIVQYSKSAVTKLEFNNEETWEIVNDTIMNLEWTGDVALSAEAMDLAMIQFRRSRADAARAIVLFSDGNSYNTWEEVGAAAERLEYSKAKINSVSLTGNIYEPELNRYLSFSNGTIVRRQSEFEQLKKDLMAMTVPHCPPPAATPPSDFLRAAESNPDGEGVGNQLPTRRTRRPNHGGAGGDDRRGGEADEAGGEGRSSRRSTRRHGATRSSRSTSTTSSGSSSSSSFSSTSSPSSTGSPRGASHTPPVLVDARIDRRHV